MISFVSASRWRPDAPDFTDEVILSDLQNCVSSGSRRISIPVSSDASVALASSEKAMGIGLWTGVESVLTKATQAYFGSVFFGTPLKLYEGLVTIGAVPPVAAPVDVSIAGGYMTGAYVSRPWEFVQYQDSIIATNWADPIQSKVPVNGDATGKFGNLISAGDAPRCSKMAILGDRLLLGDIVTDAVTALGAAGDYPDYVWLSEPGAPTSYDTTAGSETRRIVAVPGPVTALVGGGEVAVVFKQMGYTLLALDGSSLIFRSTDHNTGVGTSWSRSVVQVGPEIYFWGTRGGIWRISGYGPPERISGDIDAWMRIRDTGATGAHADSPILGPPLTDADTDFPELYVWGWYDSALDAILWLYSKAVPAGSSYRILGYDRNSGEFFRVVPGDFGTNLENVYAGAGLNSWLLDISSGQQTSSLLLYSTSAPAQLMAVFGGSSHAVVRMSTTWFSPTAMEQDQRVQRTRVNRIQPVFSGGGTVPGYSVKIYYTNNPNRITTKSVEMYNPEDNVDGWLHPGDDVVGTWFRVDMTIGKSPAGEAAFSGYNLRGIEGFMIDHEVGGTL